MATKVATHLEITEPNLVVYYRKSEDMIDERLGPPCPRRHTKYLRNCQLSASVWLIRDTCMSEHLLHELPMLITVEGAIKGQNSTTAFQAIPCHFEFIHSVHILDMQLDAGAIGSLSRPQIQVLVPPSLEVQGIVAVMQIGEFRKKVQVVFRIKLRIYEEVQLSIDYGQIARLVHTFLHMRKQCF